MAGNNLAVAAGKIQIKREIQKDDDEDPLDLGHNSDLRSSAPKVIRLDNMGSTNVGSTLRFTPIAPKPSIIGISSSSTTKVSVAKDIPKAKTPDLYMLNKPAPIPFNLPKEASLVPRNASDDPMNDTPHVALAKLENEAKTLKEEVAALKWLAKRKEQEWNSVLVLLKKKEENWLKVKRQADLVATDPTFSKMKTITNTMTTNNSNPAVRMPSPPPPIKVVQPQFSNTGSTMKIISKVNCNSTSSTNAVNSVPSISNNPTQPKKVLVPVSQPLTAETLQALSSQGLVKSGGMTADGKRIIVVKKSATGGPISASGLGGQQIRIISKSTMVSSSPTISTLSTSGVKVVSVTSSSSSNSSPKIISSASLAASKTEKKAPSLCQACYKVPPKFECSGCSNMWYCSQICQKDNWTTHQKKCKTVIKQEVPDEIA